LAFQNLQCHKREHRETGEKERSNNSDIPSEMKKRNFKPNVEKKYWRFWKKKDMGMV
jgi:hypothetical protein